MLGGFLLVFIMCLVSDNGGTDDDFGGNAFCSTSECLSLSYVCLRCDVTIVLGLV